MELSLLISRPYHRERMLECSSVITRIFNVKKRSLSVSSRVISENDSLVIASSEGERGPWTKECR